MSSPRNLDMEGRRLRMLLSVAAGALLLALAGVQVREYQRDWRRVQRGFAPFDKRPSASSGIRQINACTQAVDRCPTCHLGMGRPELADAEIPLPYRGHGPGIGKHDPNVIGCTACHGGQGRVLDSIVSHAHPKGIGPDPLMTSPHIQASCVRCHVPGEKPGQERLVAGARIYAALGCPVCHPLVDQGKGGWDFGPDLTAINRPTPAEYETSILEPTANFAGSTMPSFKLALEADEVAMESLLIYLESLTLPRAAGCNAAPKASGRVESPCADCHAGDAGKASGRMKHACPFIRARADELACHRCHAETVPEPGIRNGYCPLISKHRDACVLCHTDLREGRRP